MPAVQQGRARSSTATISPALAAVNRGGAVASPGDRGVQWDPVEGLAAVGGGRTARREPARAVILFLVAIFSGVSGMQHVDWYFDFISPYASLGMLRLGELPQDLEIRYRPVLFAGLLNHWEQKGPAEIPPKRSWTYRSCTWWATRHRIPFRFPAAHPFNSLPYLRLAIAAGNTGEAVRRIFTALWTTAADPADPRLVADLALSLAVDPAELSRREVKDALRVGTEQAIAQGVFGVPTLGVGSELFWGADATDFASACLADPGILATAEMKRVAALPVGASRIPG
jgi:2-hydroxychromene-2-carboxylate isomerase